MIPAGAQESGPDGNDQHRRDPRSRGEITTPLAAAQARTAFASAAKDALAALERMVDLHGTKGMAVSHPVQRFWRDASVGARHVLLNQFMIEEEYGKLLAGQ